MALHVISRLLAYESVTGSIVRARKTGGGVLQLPDFDFELLDALDKGVHLLAIGPELMKHLNAASELDGKQAAGGNAL
jgi:hypothetical protein